VEKGADINQVQSDKTTLMHIAAFNGFLSIVEFLVGKGMETNARSIQFLKQKIILLLYI